MIFKQNPMKINDFIAKSCRNFVPMDDTLTPEPAVWSDQYDRRPSLKPGKVPRTRKSKGGAGEKHAKVRPAVSKPATKKPRAPAKEVGDRRRISSEH